MSDSATPTPSASLPAPTIPPAGGIGRPVPYHPSTGPQPNTGSQPTRSQLQAHHNRRPEHHSSQRREGRSRSRRILVWSILVVVVGVVVGAGLVARSRLQAPPPVATVAVTLASAAPVPAATPAITLPWAPTGQSAVAIPAVGYTAQSGTEHPVPVASMTKVMTAYLILKDHPIKPGDDGPTITITPTDVANYATDTETDQANVPVQSGETLTERQMLEGMLVHSANNLAYALAVWDAGSLTAFVAKMNTAAAALGMTQSHFADASGYDPGSQSTPSDLLKLASVEMANPTFALMVSKPSVTLPMAGTVYSFTPLLPGGPNGTPGVIGVKSGFTSVAGGGDILAYQASVGGKPFVVLAAVTSQEGATVLEVAGRAALTVAQAAASHVVSMPVAHAGQQVGTANVRDKQVPVAAVSAVSLLAWPGQSVRQSVVVTHHPSAGAASGSPIGTALFSLGHQQMAVPVRTTAPIPKLTLTQRLF